MRSCGIRVILRSFKPLYQIPNNYEITVMSTELAIVPPFLLGGRIFFAAAFLYELYRETFSVFVTVWRVSTAILLSVAYLLRMAIDESVLLFIIILVFIVLVFGIYRNCERKPAGRKHVKWADPLVHTIFI